MALPGGRHLLAGLGAYDQPETRVCGITGDELGGLAGRTLTVRGARS
jgi:hypothetical protein